MVPRENETQLSVVIPAFNVGEVVVPTLEDLKCVLNSVNQCSEIIVVEDGSKDDTYRRLVLCRERIGMRILRNARNMGKGFSIKRGIESAGGRWTVVMDADGDIDPSLLKGYLDALSHADIVIASKRLPQSTYEAPLIRKLLSFCFHWLVILLTGIRVTDSQTGFKAFRTLEAKKIMKVVVAKRYAFDVEVLAVANLLGLKVVELPVEVRLKRLFSIRDAMSMMKDLLGITYRLRVTRWYQDRLRKKEMDRQ